MTGALKMEDREMQECCRTPFGLHFPVLFLLPLFFFGHPFPVFHFPSTPHDTGMTLLLIRTIMMIVKNHCPTYDKLQAVIVVYIDC